MTYRELCRYVGHTVKTLSGYGRLEQVLDANHIRVMLSSQFSKPKKDQKTKTFKDSEVTLVK